MSCRVAPTHRCVGPDLITSLESKLNRFGYVAGSLATGTESPGHARVRAAAAAAAAAGQGTQASSSAARIQSPARLAASQQKVSRGADQLHPSHNQNVMRSHGQLEAVGLVYMCLLASCITRVAWSGVEKPASSKETMRCVDKRVMTMRAAVLLHQQKATGDVPDSCGTTVVCLVRRAQCTGWPWHWSAPTWHCRSGRTATARPGPAPGTTAARAAPRQRCRHPSRQPQAVSLPARLFTGHGNLHLCLWGKTVNSSVTG